LLEEGARERFLAVQDIALEQSAAVGDADLRRLKRQFSSLKNSFVHYNMKQHFLASLADGHPMGTEEAHLQGFEADLAKHLENLRAAKASNAEAEQEVEALVGRLVDALNGLEQQRAGVATEVARLAAELRAAEEAAARPLPKVPADDGPEGLDECQAALAEAAEEARQLEAQIAALTVGFCSFIFSSSTRPLQGGPL
jgi:chromosome segregation ATPase